jgi:hypothetical protein
MMWTCPECGEPNEDHFQHCWKCASDAMEEAAPPTTEAPARELRSLGSVLLRAVVGFLLGGIVGLAIGQIQGRPLSDVIAFVLLWGLAVGASVGLITWVVFPYKAHQSRER